MEKEDKMPIPEPNPPEFVFNEPLVLSSSQAAGACLSALFFLLLAWGGLAFFRADLAPPFGVKSLLASVAVMQLAPVFGVVLFLFFQVPAGQRRAGAGFKDFSLCCLRQGLITVLWLIPLTGFLTFCCRWLFHRLLPGFPVAENPISLVLTSTDPWLIGFLGLAAVVVAPLAEELVIRRMLYTAFLPAGKAFAMTGASLTFALLHGTPADLLPLFLLGVILQRRYISKGNLWDSICLHSLFNGGMLLLALIVRSG